MFHDSLKAWLLTGKVQGLLMNIGSKSQMKNDQKKPCPPPLCRPNERQCALILLRLIHLKDEETSALITRIRISELTLKRLWGRHRLDPALVEAVGDWLLFSGWVLFFAGSTYALIRSSSVEGWVRASSRAVSEDIKAIEDGRFDFTSLEPLLRQYEAPTDGV